MGPRRRKHLERLGVFSVTDLLLLEPRRYEDRTTVQPVQEVLRSGGEGLVAATVAAHDFFPARGERVLKILLQEDTGEVIALVCFGRPFLQRTFPAGTALRVYGHFQYRHGEIQSSSFDAERASVPHRAMLVPVYPLTEGLTQQIIRRAVASALERVAQHHHREDLTLQGLASLPPDVPSRCHLVSLREALEGLHRPTHPSEITAARRRLVFQELFAFQLDLTRNTLERRRGVQRTRHPPERAIRAAIAASLPFDLTADQHTVLEEIIRDLDAPWPMARLLQGDVGSGKTLVALLAAAHVADRHEQTVLLVPTELLAQQHYRNLTAYAGDAGLRTAVLTGRTAGGARRQVEAEMANGTVDLVVGTHALLSETHTWHSLSLVIIDEQHRFGVDQRQKLMHQPTVPDLLMMSATPIPRSLALTAFGDCEISSIRTMPPGRSAVATRLARMGNEERVYAFVRRELERGHQAYLVYPAIESSEKRELRSAEEMLPELQRRLAPYPVGLAHSRRHGDERLSTMQQFEQGEIAALVATSVVEVGVDVPNATVMVVEHAERFGLAALHQLRGRVGRGTAPGHCILVYQEPVTPEARERLRVLYQTTDGFILAEEDLRIRGPGDLAGREQSGYLQFRLADIRRDMEIMLEARDAVREYLEEHP